MTTPLQSLEYAALVAAKEARDAAYAKYEGFRKALDAAADVLNSVKPEGLLDAQRDIIAAATKMAYMRLACETIFEADVAAAQAAFDAAYPAPADAKTALQEAAKQREVWLDRADAVLLRNVLGLNMGEIAKMEAFRDVFGLPTVAYYGLFTGNLFEWFLSVQFTDDTAQTVRRIAFGAGVVGAPDDLNSFTVYTEDFADALAAAVNATLRNERLDKTI